MKRILFSFATLFLLSGIVFAQAKSSAGALPRKAEFSLNLNAIPIGIEEGEASLIFGLGLRVDLRAARSLTLAPEFIVLTTHEFSGAILLPAITLNYWLGPFSIGAGGAFPIYEGVGFIPKFNVGLRIGRLSLNGYVLTYLTGYSALWGWSIGYVF